MVEVFLIPNQRLCHFNQNKSSSRNNMVFGHQLSLECSNPGHLVFVCRYVTVIDMLNRFKVIGIFLCSQGR